MSSRRFNADMPLDSATRASVEELKRHEREARSFFEEIREQQLRDHPPLDHNGHTAAQRANATQMANKAVAIRFLGWPSSTSRDSSGSG